MSKKAVCCILLVVIVIAAALFFPILMFRHQQHITKVLYYGKEDAVYAYRINADQGYGWIRNPVRSLK